MRSADSRIASPRLATIPWPYGPIAVALAALLPTACAEAERSGKASDPPAPETAAQPATRLDCAAITTTSLSLWDAEITLAQSLPAGTDATLGQSYPGHCQVQGRIDPRTGVDGKPYAIGFEVRMPDHWNGKFLFQGGAGTDGVLLPAFGLILGTSPAAANALTLGYAVVSTDGGHLTEPAPPFVGGVMFGLDPQARIDYGYRALQLSLVMGKYIVARHYGALPARSYFEGCSNGGRQGLVAAARLSDQFDGILVGDPGFNLPRAALQAAWDAQHLLPLAPSFGAAFSIADMALVGRRIADRCDALDGAVDGMVNDAAACQATFHLASDVPTCPGAPDGTCLTAAQKSALQAIMNGPSNIAGEPLYARWLWDPGIASSAVGFFSWRMWRLENPQFGGLPMATALSSGALAQVFSAPPTPLGTGDAGAIVQRLIGYLARFNFDSDAPKIFATTPEFPESAMSFMTPPHATSLAGFRRRGKLIVFHGTADPAFSAADTLDWYAALTRGDGPDFARFYLVPGMGHCSGGMATDRFDLLAPLVDWVERGVAPAAVTASVTPGNTDVPASWSPARTRPLCPYPQKAVRLPGASDLESASSFACR